MVVVPDARDLMPQPGALEADQAAELARVQASQRTPSQSPPGAKTRT